MAALTWDTDSKKLYSTGNKDGILFAPLLSTKGTHSRYGTGVAWNGLANVTETPGGAEANDTYADDIKYISLRGAETFNQTIEAYMAPDEWAQCDGQATTGTATSDDYKIGMFGQQTRKAFGFVFKSTVGNDTEHNDYGFDIHISYNLTASPSERSYQSINENPEAMTYSWECTSDPVMVLKSDGSGEKWLDKPTSNVIVRCTTGNDVLVSTNGTVTFNTATVQGKNAQLLWDVLKGTLTTKPTLPDPGDVYEILNLASDSTKTVSDYADAAQ
jgi:hypothetical protein